MKKRTYKRMQNRLYREIKRRILAEQALKFPIPAQIHVENRNIDTLKVRNKIDRRRLLPYDRGMIEYTKREMANRIAEKLYEDGYIYFLSEEPSYGQAFDYVEVEARIDVVRQNTELMKGDE